jgi:hypothetical protein
MMTVNGEHIGGTIEGVVVDWIFGFDFDVEVSIDYE